MMNFHRNFYFRRQEVREIAFKKDSSSRSYLLVAEVFSPWQKANRDERATGEIVGSRKLYGTCLPDGQAIRRLTFIK
jgi:hypothetical protein